MVNRGGLQGTRVLIVEDEQAAVEASERYLKNHGCDVQSASSEAEALQTAEDFEPDVLVCDWNLGDGSSGTDVAEKLQEQTDVPVIMISAHPLSKLREAARKINVVRFLRKPFRLSVLMDAIRRAVS